MVELTDDFCLANSLPFNFTIFSTKNCENVVAEKEKPANLKHGTRTKVKMIDASRVQ